MSPPYSPLDCWCCWEDGAVLVVLVTETDIECEVEVEVLELTESP